MKIIACGSVPTVRASTDYFTGDVLQTPIIKAEAPACLRAALVSFAPGARTAWHTHPRGQTLYVTAGAGRVQSWGEPARDIQAGDVVFFKAGEKHWHGARPDTTLTHVAMQEADEKDQVVEWLEQVSDEQYGA